MKNDSDSDEFHREEPPPPRRPAPRLRHVLGFALLLAVVGYFGVWRGWQFGVEQWGAFWGGVIGVAALAGLAVIATVGYIVIRTMPVMEGAAETNQEESRRP